MMRGINKTMRESRRYETKKKSLAIARMHVTNK